METEDEKENENEIYVNFKSLVSQFNEIYKSQEGHRSIKLRNILDIQKFDIDDIEKKINNKLFYVMSLYKKFVDRDIISDNVDDIPDPRWEFQKIIKILMFSRKMLIYDCLVENCYNPTRENEFKDTIEGITDMIPITEETELNNYQKLILNMISRLNELEYKRYNEYCYEKIYTDDNYFSYAWGQKVSIENFVLSSIDRNMAPENWKLATMDKSSIKSVIEYLTKCIDINFPELKKNRNIFSFKNGVYITRIPNGNNGYTDYFYKYGEKPSLPPDTVACKYFDDYFENFDGIHWSEIDTSVFQSILEYQYGSDKKQCKDISYWVYVFLGRLLYNCGELDDWQVMLYIRGAAGTGKSSILTQIIQKFYEPNDVGIMSNDIERTFGLSALYDKFIFIGPEIKRNFSLSQALLQSIISGEDLSIPIKHHTAEALKWTVPGIMAGNEIPNYQDASGSISRRFVILDFKRKVEENKSDPHLRDKLNKEIPRMIKKCNLAYLEAVKKYGDKNIWAQLPVYFHQTRMALKEQTNVLINFLLSDKISFVANGSTSELEFKNTFNDHCKMNNLPRVPLNAELYDTPFQEISIVAGHTVVFCKGDGVTKDAYGHVIGNHIKGIIINEMEEYE